MFTGLLMILMAAVGYPRGEHYWIDLADVEPVAVAALDFEVLFSADGYDCAIDIDEDGVLCVPDGCTVTVEFEYAAFEFSTCMEPLEADGYVWAVCYDPIPGSVIAHELWMDGYGGFCAGVGALHTRGGGIEHCTLGPGMYSNLVAELPDYDD